MLATARIATPHHNPIARSLGLDDAPSLTARTLPSAGLEMSRITIGPAQLGRTAEIPPQDTFVVALYLTEVQRHELWRGSRRAVAQGYRANAMRIVNLREGYSAHMYQPHEAISITLPRPVLDAFTYQANGRRIGELACEPGIVDPVIAHLGAALLPAFGNPAEADPLFTDHVGLAMCAHLTRHYGGLPDAPIATGGLTRRQESLARELLASRMAEGLSLGELAEACGLSRSHFARAFKTSTGLTPHQWLQRHRVGKAKERLLWSPLSIAEIALELGFADQSHLTRVFTRLVGESPAAWRRQRR